MKYKYDKKSLQFIPVKSKNWIYFLAGTLIFSCLSAGIATKIVIDKVPVIIRYEEKPFSEEALKEEINNLHIKFKDIVIAQAIIEGASKSGRKWQNPLFLNGNNLFGMKKSYNRPSTAISWVEDDYCVYSSWQDCIKDFAIWQGQNCNKIHNSEEYLIFLKEMGYSIDPNYITLINKIYK